MRRWLLVALLWVALVLNYVDRQAIFSLFPLLRSEFGLSDVQLGLMSTVFLWIYGVASPIGGWVADRFGAVRTIVFSLLVWSSVTWATALAGSFTMLLMSRALMGISEAFYLPAALALISGLHGERTRSRAIGLHQSGIYVGIIFAGWAAAWIAEHHGWRTVFHWLGAAGVLYTPVIAWSLRGEHPPVQGAAFRGALALLLCGPVLRLASLSALLAAAVWVVSTWMPLYFFERFGLSLTAAGFSATFFMQAAAFGGVFAGSALSDWWTARNPQGRRFTMMIAFGIAAPFVLLAGSAGTVALVILGLAMFGIGRGFYDANMMPLLAGATDARFHATAYGITNLAGCLAGGAMAAAAGGLKATIGLGGAIQLSAALLAAGLIVLQRPVRSAQA